MTELTGKCVRHGGKRGVDTLCRVYDIGMGRCGTRSICRALEYMGLRVRHGLDDCIPCERDAVGKAIRGQWNFDALWTCDYASDWPSVIWRDLYENIPGAKFVLPLRSVKGWKRSWKAYNERTERKTRMFETSVAKWTHVRRFLLFGMLGWDAERWSRAYKRHIDDVLATVPSDRLLTLDVWQMEDQELWDRLAGFLGLKAPAGLPFPNGRGRVKLRLHSMTRRSRRKVRRRLMLQGARTWTRGSSI